MTKTSRKSKEQLVEEFRTEVRKYIETGESDVLTAKEKAILDPVRPKAKKPSKLWDALKSYLYN
jgi:hypothetical protein